MMSASGSSRNRSPFTATQWQELEHQALILKYMVSGVPVPPDLIYSVKRSLESSFSSRFFPPHNIGWGCFEMGYGRKADPEPGRCRRTDGKKWRCSKEAYPDSKYCERHMHRGRNRSRKPVEISSTTTTTTTTPITPSSSVLSSVGNLPTSIRTTSSSSFSPSSFASSSLTTEISSYHHAYHDSHHLHPFINNLHYSSSPRPSDLPLFGDKTSPELILNSRSNVHSTVYRCGQRTREGAEERSLFQDSSESARSLAASCQPLAMGSYKGFSDSQSHFQSLMANTKQQQHPQDQHCFVLGADFKSPAVTHATEKESEKKPFHRFFEEFPQKSAEPWLDLASNSNG